MRMEKEFQTMSATEQKEAIRLLNLAIKQHQFDYKHANPMQQNCYISSGSVEGIFFPNTEIYATANGNHFAPCHEFVALVKYNGDLGICFAYKDEYLQELTKNATEENKQHIYNRLSGYYFEPLANIVYTYEERTLIDELQKRISKLKTDIATLKNIKVIYKKDGKPFANILNAFDPKPYCDVSIRACIEAYATNITIYESITHIAASGDKYNTYNTIYLYGIESAEQILPKVRELINNYTASIEELNRDIKNIKKVSKAISQFQNAIACFSSSAQHFIKYNMRY